jgi:hypothetical protein
MTDINSTFMQYVFAYMEVGKGREQGAEASTCGPTFRRKLSAYRT